jgi:flavin reductase
MNRPVPPVRAAIDEGLEAARRFREGMSRVAGAVHVITTDGPSGRAGFTATAVAPVTDEPPTLLVCVNAAGRSARRLTENGRFAVNTLSAADEAVAAAFARPGVASPEARFAAGRWMALQSGAPVLETSLVAFDCRVLEARRVATHYVVIGEVLDLRLGPQAGPLLYWGRAYRAL